jgi:hypothetical protein
MTESKSVALPLGDSPTIMVGIARFELAALCSQGRCATGLRYIPTFLDKKYNTILSKISQYIFKKNSKNLNLYNFLISFNNMFIFIYINGILINKVLKNNYRRRI